MWEKPIEASLLKHKGIRSVKAGYATKAVTVTYNTHLIFSGRQCSSRQLERIWNS